MKNLGINKKIVALVLSAVIGVSSGTYVLIKQVEYKKIISAVEIELEEENQRFIDLVEGLEIRSVEFTSIGNSIAAGYSLKDEVIPLMIRNKNLISRLNNKNIVMQYYQFARPQDNNDEHIYDWLINNTKQSEVNEQIRYDYIGKGSGVDSTYISNKKVYEYFPTIVNDDRGINDIISSVNDNDMALIIYNGGTGSFLDNLTRKSEDLFDSFNRDKTSIESFCKYIYLKNPKVQIYLCGVPNFLNLGFNEMLNQKYRQLAEFYPNVTYVEAAPEKVFYDTEEGTKVDIHYNREEYLCLNKNIIQSICDNYVCNRICIELCQSIRSLNQEIQFKNRDLLKNREIIETYITRVLDNYTNSNLDKSQIISGINEFIKLYRVRYGYDYYYTSKEMTIEILEEYKNQLSSNKTM